MKLIRHILSHLTLLVIVFALVSVFYYRHQLLPESVSSEVDVFVEKIHPSIKSFARAKASTASIVVASTDNSIVVPEPESELEAVTSVDNKVEETTAAENTNQEAIVTEASIPEQANKENTQQASATDNDLPVANSDVVDKVDAVAQSIPAEEQTHAPKFDIDNGSVDDTLRIARNEFIRGDLSASINAYKQLNELDNNEADFYGELGNVYYSQGNWSEAGLAYYEAATRLIEKKQFSQVNYLQRVIQGLNADYADKLASQLMNVN